MAGKQRWRSLGSFSLRCLGSLALRTILGLTLLASTPSVVWPQQRLASQSFLGLPSGRNSVVARRSSSQRSTENPPHAARTSRVALASHQPEEILTPGERTIPDGPPPSQVLEDGLSVAIEPDGEHHLLMDSAIYNAQSYGWCSPWWARAELLVWWTEGLQTPPLVTASPADPFSNILFGGRLNDEARVGGRFAVGHWLTPYDVGVEVSYLFLGQEASNFAADQQTNPMLGRPFFNAETNTEDAELVASPGVLDGTVTVSSSTEFDSFEVTLQKYLCCQCDYRLGGQIGYRSASLDDDLRITESLLSLDASSGAAPGTTIELFDQFDTRNEFHGVSLGVAGEYRYCEWNLDLLIKLGLGNTRSRVAIDGATTITTTGPSTSTNAGGLLAQSTNIGNYEQDDFTVIPELGAQLTYVVNPCWRASVGYTLLYWPGVARGGEQIDPLLNLSQLPPGPLTGAPLPRFQFIRSDFWAQGLNFTLEFRR